MIQKQHRRYGPVFRVSPNELSFASVSSWNAIYGYPPSGQGQLIKGEFYDIYGAGFKTGCIGSERNPAEHSRKKKGLTAAFSVKALEQQEAVVQDVVDGSCFQQGQMQLLDINMANQSISRVRPKAWPAQRREQGAGHKPREMARNPDFRYPWRDGIW